MTNAFSDLNRDGMSDLVWSDPKANRATVWLMRGTVPFERGPELPGASRSRLGMRPGHRFQR